MLDVSLNNAVKIIITEKLSIIITDLNKSLLFFVLQVDKLLF